MPSFPQAGLMRRRSDLTTTAWVLVLLFALKPLSVSAQEGSWTVSAGGGYAYVFLGQVKGDMDRDVKGYNAVGLLLPPFPSPSSAFALSGKATYRFDREYSWSISLGAVKRTVGTSWEDGTYALSLDRTIGSTTALLGLAYHFPADLGGDLYAEVQLGYLFAKATSSANWTKTTKVADSTGAYVLVKETLDDTRGTFTKSKLIVAAAVGGTLRISGPFFLRGEAVYRFGQMGKIDGSKTQFGQTVDQTTSIEFDFSALVVSVSIGIEFD